MAELERFIHDQPERTSSLLKAALAHVQFETIHPFLDGNGRVGRLLITLLLCVEGVLQEPLLYLSLYLKEHRPEYYELLDVVRRVGDWEGGLRSSRMQSRTQRQELSNGPQARRAIPPGP